MSTKPCQIKVKTFVDFSLVQKKDLFDSQCAMLWCPVYPVTTAKRPARKNRCEKGWGKNQEFISPKRDVTRIPLLINDP